MDTNSKEKEKKDIQEKKPAQGVSPQQVGTFAGLNITKYERA